MFQGNFMKSSSWISPMGSNLLTSVLISSRRKNWLETLHVSSHLCKKKKKKKKKDTQEGIIRKYNEVHYPQGMGGWEWGEKHGGAGGSGKN